VTDNQPKTCKAKGAHLELVPGALIVFWWVTKEGTRNAGKALEAVAAIRLPVLLHWPVCSALFPPVNAFFCYTRHIVCKARRHGRRNRVRSHPVTVLSTGLRLAGLPSRNSTRTCTHHGFTVRLTFPFSKDISKTPHFMWRLAPWDDPNGIEHSRYYYELSIIKTIYH
jgi:hypothetical protein